MWRAFFFKRHAPDYTKNMVEQHENTEAPHYIGKLDRPDLIAILRTPSIVPTAEERKRLGLVVTKSLAD